MGMVFGLEPPKTDLLAVVKEAEETVFLPVKQNMNFYKGEKL